MKNLNVEYGIIAIPYVGIKYIILFTLCFGFSRSIAQTTILKKTDSLYYLVDTINTPVNDRMWEVQSDKINKYYTIKCPCLKNNGKPTFSYSIQKQDIGMNLTNKAFKLLNLISLSDLILKSKYIEDNGYERDDVIFLIERSGKEYIVHKVDFANLAVHITSPPDYIDAGAKKTP